MRIFTTNPPPTHPAQGKLKRNRESIELWRNMAESRIQNAPLTPDFHPSNGHPARTAIIKIFRIRNAHGLRDRQANKNAPSNTETWLVALQ